MFAAAKTSRNKWKRRNRPFLFLSSKRPKNTGSSPVNLLKLNRPLSCLVAYARACTHGSAPVDAATPIVGHRCAVTRRWGSTTYFSFKISGLSLSLFFYYRVSEPVWFSLFIPQLSQDSVKYFPDDEDK